MAASQPENADLHGKLSALTSFLQKAARSTQSIVIPTSIDESIDGLIKSDNSGQYLFERTDVDSLTHSLEEGGRSVCSRLSSRAFILLFAMLRLSQPCMSLQRALCLLTESLQEEDGTFSVAQSTQDGENSLLQRKKRKIGREILDRSFSAFCNDQMSHFIRRWMGLLSLELIKDCSENQSLLSSFIKGQRGMLGEIISKDRDTLVRYVAGLIVKEMLSEGQITLRICWPKTADWVTYENFPKPGNSQNESQWIERFMGYADDVHLQDSLAKTCNSFVWSVTLYGDKTETFDHETNPTILVSLRSALSIFIPASGERNSQYFDVFVSHIRDGTVWQIPNSTSFGSLKPHELELVLNSSDDGNLFQNGLAKNVERVSLQFFDQTIAEKFIQHMHITGKRKSRGFVGSQVTEILDLSQTHTPNHGRTIATLQPSKARGALPEPLNSDPPQDMPLKDQSLPALSQVATPKYSQTLATFGLHNALSTDVLARDSSHDVSDGDGLSSHRRSERMDATTTPLEPHTTIGSPRPQADGRKYRSRDLQDGQSEEQITSANMEARKRQKSDTRGAQGEHRSEHTIAKPAKLIKQTQASHASHGSRPSHGRGRPSKTVERSHSNENNPFLWDVPVSPSGHKIKTYSAKGKPQSKTSGKRGSVTQQYGSDRSIASGEGPSPKRNRAGSHSTGARSTRQSKRSRKSNPDSDSDFEPSQRLAPIKRAQQRPQNSRAKPLLQKQSHDIRAGASQPHASVIPPNESQPVKKTAVEAKGKLHRVNNAEGASRDLEHTEGPCLDGDDSRQAEALDKFRATTGNGLNEEQLHGRAKPQALFDDRGKLHSLSKTSGTGNTENNLNQGKNTSVEGLHKTADDPVELRKGSGAMYNAKSRVSVERNNDDPFIRHEKASSSAHYHAGNADPDQHPLRPSEHFDEAIAFLEDPLEGFSVGRKADHDFPPGPRDHPRHGEHTNSDTAYEGHSSATSVVGEKKISKPLQQDRFVNARKDSKAILRPQDNVKGQGRRPDHKNLARDQKDMSFKSTKVSDYLSNKQLTRSQEHATRKDQLGSKLQSALSDVVESDAASISSERRLATRKPRGSTTRPANHGPVETANLRTSERVHRTPRTRTADVSTKKQVQPKESEIGAPMPKVKGSKQVMAPTMLPRKLDLKNKGMIQDKMPSSKVIDLTSGVTGSSDSEDDQTNLGERKRNPRANTRAGTERALLKSKVRPRESTEQERMSHQHVVQRAEEYREMLATPKKSRPSIRQPITPGPVDFTFGPEKLRSGLVDDRLNKKPIIISFGNEGPLNQGRSSERGQVGSLPLLPIERTDPQRQLSPLLSMPEVRNQSQKSKLAQVAENGSPIPSQEKRRMLKTKVDATKLMNELPTEDLVMDADDIGELPALSLELPQAKRLDPPSMPPSIRFHRNDAIPSSNKKTVPSSPQAQSRMLDDIEVHREQPQGYVSVKDSGVIRHASPPDPFKENSGESSGSRAFVQELKNSATTHGKSEAQEIAVRVDRSPEKIIESVPQDPDKTLVGSRTEFPRQVYYLNESTGSSSPEDMENSPTSSRIDAEAKRAAEIDRWQQSLREDQAQTLTHLYDFSNRFVRHLNSKEAVFDDIVKDYEHNGLRLIKEAKQNHADAHSRFMISAASAKRRLQDELTATEKALYAHADNCKRRRLEISERQQSVNLRTGERVLKTLEEALA